MILDLKDFLRMHELHPKPEQLLEVLLSDYVDTANDLVDLSEADLQGLDDEHKWFKKVHKNRLKRAIASLRQALSAADSSDGDGDGGGGGGDTAADRAEEASKAERPGQQQWVAVPRKPTNPHETSVTRHEAISILWSPLFPP